MNYWPVLPIQSDSSTTHCLFHQLLTPIRQIFFPKPNSTSAITEWKSRLSALIGWKQKRAFWLAESPTQAFWFTAVNFPLDWIKYLSIYLNVPIGQKQNWVFWLAESLNWVFWLVGSRTDCSDWLKAELRTGWNSKLSVLIGWKLKRSFWLAESRNDHSDWLKADVIVRTDWKSKGSILIGGK